MGIFTLIGVSVYPTAIAKETNGGMVCLAIHLVGAGMMFVGYMVCEFKALEMFGLKLSEAVQGKYLDVLGKERSFRQICAFSMFVFYLLFLVFEVLMIVQDPCCGDEWLPQGTWYNRTLTTGDASYNTTHVSWHILTEATVKNTATGTYFWYKVGAYSGECLAGVFLILSHLAIWFYCEERHVKYATSSLDMVFDEAANPGGFCFDDEEDDDEEDEDVELMG
jgi:hypothetical protein